MLPVVMKSILQSRWEGQVVMMDEALESIVMKMERRWRMDLTCGDGMRCFVVFSPWCPSGLHNKNLVWRGGATDLSYGHPVQTGVTVPVVGKTTTSYLHGLVHLVIILSRNSSLLAIDFLLKMSIFAHNQITRIFAHHCNNQWLTTNSERYFHQNGGRYHV
jgi:hypothetical protein